MTLAVHVQFKQQIRDGIKSSLQLALGRGDFSRALLHHDLQVPLVLTQFNPQLGHVTQQQTKQRRQGDL